MTGKPFARKFDDDMVLRIRQSKASNQTWADALAVRASTIARIRLGWCYKHLPCDPEYKTKAHERRRTAGVGSRHNRQGKRHDLEA